MELLKEQTDVSLELARMLVALHQGFIDISHTENNAVKIAVFFGANRIRFVDTPDK